MGSKRFEALDGMRGVAAVTVVLFHCFLSDKASIAPNGFLSVDLFFVLSGFVIALSYETKLQAGLGVRRFLQARSSRLLPVHFAAMVPAMAFAIVGYTHGWNALPGLSVTAMLIAGLLNALFVPDPISPVASIFAPLNQAFPLNPSLWSLWGEWCVNALYAFCMYGMRTRAIIAAGVVSLSVISWFAFRDGTWNFGATHNGNLLGLFRALGGFAAGVSICRAYRKGWLNRLPGIRPEIIYALWFVICIWPIWRNPLWQGIVATVIAPAAVALLVRGERPIGSALTWLGAVSYPLYASHYWLLETIRSLIRHSSMSAELYRAIPTVVFAIPMVIAALALARLVAAVSGLQIAEQHKAAVY